MTTKHSAVGKFKVLDFGNGQLVAGAARMDRTIIDVHQSVVTVFGNQHTHYANHVIEYKFNDGIAITFARLGDEAEVRIAVTPGFRRLVMPDIVQRRPSWVAHADPASVVTDETHAAVVASYAFGPDRPHAERIDYYTNPISKTLGVTTRCTLVSFPETGQPESMADHVAFRLKPEPVADQRPFVTHEARRVRLPTLAPLPLAPPDCTVVEVPRLVFDPQGTAMAERSLVASSGDDNAMAISRIYYLESVVRAGWEKARECLAAAGLEIVDV
ncbi:hypothetical protein [Medusavirus stheno T3]|uniref:Uncharacterized protein n=1 Tax=Medusavirus stheno T3 TaxID=3069717 RepID=A0A7S7YEG2_9VIRU|nr:hypothetical protein QKU73_gp101 [Acanthamoeba castellanii medusavirus]QPB44282.1 hypothetical protein [Medusavirus stheno T3]